MILHRLLLLPCCLAFLSCSAAVYTSGRNPADLVGRSRASITAEFGKPVRSDMVRHRERPLTHPPKFTEEHSEVVLVKGPWRHDLLASEALETAIFTLCIGEPILFPYSIAHKSVLNRREQELELVYANGTVKSASMAFTGSQKLPGPNP